MSYGGKEDEVPGVCAMAREATSAVFITGAERWSRVFRWLSGLYWGAVGARQSPAVFRTDSRRSAVTGLGRRR